MSDLMRAVIDAALPKGALWRPVPGGDLDNLLNGIAENAEALRVFLDLLGSVRDPAKTAFLADLEKEFGLLPNNDMTDQQRRDTLIPLVYGRNSGGTIDDLQSRIDTAGFTAQVHANDPAIDPSIIAGGELLVNGELFELQPVYLVVAGEVFAGDGQTAGELTTSARTKIEYEFPADPGDWPLIFFVGGDATRDGSGFITAIADATVPAVQEQAFKRLILKTKPMHSWAVLHVNFV